LVLVDELAHSNISGTKNLKRWQDVLEILDAGIHVYTTVNIQHIESYKDIVERITDVQIRETIPDRILDRASSITLVDITPADLLQRLREGKVYTGDLSKIALNNFFQEERLTALREIALRCTAEVVDVELNEMIKALQKGKGWKPREHLLVAINHTPYSQQLVRATRRLSVALHAHWIALYVDNGEGLSSEERLMLSKNLALAQELGGEVMSVQDSDIAEGIQRIAEEKHITQIILGKSLRWKLFERSPVYRLIQISSGIDVHVIRQSQLFPKAKRRIRDYLWFKR
ncbi:MAG: sensor histidine kinase KdpD, partial [Chlamydiia bacterium]|nr:sensor histidine kinase KdpD [Chlamydiia bacterium]